MSDTYKTITNSAEGIYKNKGSKFLAFVHPVCSVEEVKELLKIYKKKYYDARHVCYAYILGHQRNDWRTNDDGEPSGTAGKPILGQINSRELTNVLAIVVRYFGGVLLGTGGLTTAYKEATSDALDHAEIILKTVDSIFSVSFDYPLLNEVMRIVKDSGAQIFTQRFDNQCLIQLCVRKQDELLLLSKFKNIFGLEVF